MIHTLEADGIYLEFGGRWVLTDIYFKCETGKITGLLGRNGQGKTCLMNIVHGTLQTRGKSVRFDGTFIYEAFRRPDLLTYLPQFNFIPGNLTLTRIFKDFDLDFGDLEAIFPEFEAKEKTKIRYLSGGQRRLVEVYVIVKSKAQFSMLDEPFSHLMPLQVEKIKEIMAAEKARKGIFITDHLYEQVVDICDHLYVLMDGKMHLINTREDVARLGYIKMPQ